MKSNKRPNVNNVNVLLTWLRPGDTGLGLLSGVTLRGGYANESGDVGHVSLLQSLLLSHNTSLYNNHTHTEADTLTDTTAEMLWKAVSIYKNQP